MFLILAIVAAVVRVAALIVFVVPVEIVTIARRVLSGVVVRAGAGKHAARKTKESCNQHTGCKAISHGRSSGGRPRDQGPRGSKSPAYSSLQRWTDREPRSVRQHTYIQGPPPIDNRWQSREDTMYASAQKDCGHRAQLAMCGGRGFIQGAGIGTEGL